MTEGNIEENKKNPLSVGERLRKELGSELEAELGLIMSEEKKESPKDNEKVTGEKPKKDISKLEDDDRKISEMMREVETKEDLIRVIEGMDSIQGSRNYEADEIIEMIKNVLEKGMTEYIDGIPRVGGIRKKVVQLAKENLGIFGEKEAEKLIRSVTSQEELLEAVDVIKNTKVMEGDPDLKSLKVILQDIFQMKGSAGLNAVPEKWGIKDKVKEILRSESKGRKDLSGINEKVLNLGGFEVKFKRNGGLIDVNIGDVSYSFTPEQLRRGVTIGPNASAKHPDISLRIGIKDGSLFAEKIEKAEAENNDPLIFTPYDPEKKPAGREKISLEEKEGESHKEEPAPEIIDAEFVDEKVSSSESREVVRSGESSDRSIESLGNELEDARRLYMVKNFSLEKSSSWAKRAFGIGKKSQLKELNDEFSYAREKYEEALKNYKDVIVSTQVGDREEAEIVADWIRRGEVIKLKAVETDIKMENSSWPGKVKEGYLSMVEKYRKLPLKKKMIIGTALMATGFGAGAAGGALAAGGVFSAWRIFSISASSAGFKQMFESAAGKMRNAKDRSSAENIVKSSEFAGEETRAYFLSRNLDKEIGKLDGRLEKMKVHEKWRTWAAIGSGVALSSIARYLGKEFTEYFNGSAKLSGNTYSSIPPTETPQGTGLSSEVPAEAPVETSVESVKPESHSSPDTGPGGPSEVQSEAPADLPVSPEHSAETVIGEKLNIPEGSSIEGTLINHLKGQGMGAEEAGKKAHLMALKFAEDNNIKYEDLFVVHEGTGINLSSDGSNILGISDPQGFNWGDMGSAEAVEAKVGPSGDVVTLEASEMTTSEIEPINQVLKNRFYGKWTDDFDAVLKGDIEFGKSVKQYISGRDIDLWNSEKGITMKEALAKDTNFGIGERLSKFYEHLSGLKNPNPENLLKVDEFRRFKEVIKPKPNEIVEKWIARIAAATRELKITKL